MTKIERDYSHRTLFDKLGVSSESRVAILGSHDEPFVNALNACLAKAAARSLRTRYDLIFVRVDLRRDLTRIARAAQCLQPNGALWVFHPKGRGASPTDSDVRAAGLAAGLVDNKISAYTDSHTATRFVIPIARRSLLSS
ncbi:MAG: DUF3052 family protein [Candidatus Eremiobacteraeota bacterium]|nr:DUF3052 family protein [Candidatus Eremiobacteraeota bacterium]